MRNRKGILCWLTVILSCCTTSAFGKVYEVGIGDDCDQGVISGMAVAPGYGPVCFYPAVLTISVGDSVHFYQYADTLFTGAHNVVADDGSFRCARGCDGEGGDGTRRATAAATPEDADIPPQTCAWTSRAKSSRRES
jgi:plastocyanin